MTRMSLEFAVFQFILEYGPVTIKQIESQVGAICRPASALEVILARLLFTNRIIKVNNNRYMAKERV